MNLKTKITAGFLALLLLVVALGGYAFYSVRRLETSSRGILKANFYSVELGQQMLQALDRLQTQPADADGLARFQSGLTRELANITEPGEQQLVDSLAARFAGYQRQANEPALEQLRAGTHRMIRLNTAALTRKNERANLAATQAGRYMLAFITLAVLIALMFVLSVPEAAVAPLRKLTLSLEHAANQDFDATIPIESNDEFGRVGRAFNRMLAELSEFRSSTTADLLLERNRARSIVNGLDEGLLLLDENRRIILANPVLCELLDLSVTQLVNRSAAEVARENDLLRTLLAPLDAPRREQALAAAPLLNIPQNGEEAFYRLAVQDLVSFNEASGKTEFVGQILTLRNVSDFKKLDQVKSNFLATVSHELKTPLSSINMSLKVLADERVDAQERQRVLGGIGRETQRLLRIVSELLDVSRLDTGAGIQLNFAATPLPAVVQFAAATVQPQLDNKHLTLVQELPEGLPTVRADVEKTTWVLINLLANAIRYSPAGEPLTVRAARVGKFVQVTVQDRGPGIATENHEKIFQRFAQIPDKSGYKGGSGLGLSIAREFITTQGGRLWVESELGSGSAFCFTLPISA
ncbi:ATP-binding protein [Hymenobacter sp. 5317J-9]|uniref:HAMP domain-containing sensor histidine kinase n=1 Tax=Hymenobacter sp. 5317J-9 TaxID=2932250 RepID=UPI001FD655F7|nr:ATP-binding protein [Hymenobacter sp. 5317J-9]UOQ98352.1 ATP-binding protein [Hymenobacter sp. 5317J-9]